MIGEGEEDGNGEKHGAQRHGEYVHGKTGAAGIPFEGGLAPFLLAFFSRLLFFCETQFVFSLKDAVRFVKFFGRDGFGKIESLHAGTAQPKKVSALFLRFHAFAEHRGLQALGDVDEIGEQRFVAPFQFGIFG